jgi:large subunit ribosomal protein L10
MARAQTSPRPEKVAVVDEVRALLSEADAAVLSEYRGLSVSALAELRASLRPAGAEYRVLKNTLARRAAEEAGCADLVPLLEGPTAITFVRGDAALAAKALREFSRAHPELVVKGGLLGLRVLRPADIEALAEIEPRPVLLARLAGGLQAPLAQAAGMFSAFARNAAYAFKALIDQRVAAGEAPPVVDAPAAETTSAPVEEAVGSADEAPAADAVTAEASEPVAADEASEPAADEASEPVAAEASEPAAAETAAAETSD